jgi:hypothetical protein
MRRLILLGLMAVMVLPAGAAKRITVAQLEQLLTAATAAHRADDAFAFQIAILDLSERLTPATLGRIEAKLPLGPRTQLALHLLADQSAFLDPPASELPATPAPDAATQLRILGKARTYVAQTLPHLPDFIATRTPYRFNDSPQTLVENGWPARAGLHPVGSSTQEITFREDRLIPAADATVDTGATAATAATSAQKPHKEFGMRTLGGEFGPLPALVLLDTDNGTLAFSRWEQTAAGQLAVYRFSVPKAASHYILNYCCLRDQSTMGRGGGGRGRGGGGGQNLNQPDADAEPYLATPGYHGSLSIDPATGIILRITLEADLHDRGPIALAENEVVYSAVSIGDRAYVRPVRSVAISQEQPASDPRPGEQPLLLLSETSYTNYHRLGATVRILTESNEPPAPAPAPAK